MVKLMIRFTPILLLIILFLILGCGGKSVDLEDDLSQRFKKAMTYYDKGKFSRARDEFDFIIMNDPGSGLAVEAQYYIGESLFQMEEYLQSAAAFDRFIRFSGDFSKMETARFRICEAAVNSSNSYQRDQSQTHQALDQLQMFIEDYPISERAAEAEGIITDLRIKLARKDYEAGRMYLKLEEYESALIYFRSVLNQYYDTPIADDARIAIIFTHILNDNAKGAQNYFTSEKERFRSEEKMGEAESLFTDPKARFNLAQFIRLYK